MAETPSPITVERTIGGHLFDITAQQVGPDEWVAGITGYADIAHAPDFERSIETPRGSAQQAHELMGKVTARGRTAEEALDRLVADLHPKIVEATRVDLEERTRAQHRRQRNQRPPWESD